MLLCLLVFLCIPTQSYQSSEKKLVEHLLQNVSRSTRPVLNTSSPVIVILGFELVHIVTIVESEQTINAKVWLRMEWVNEMMRWNPNEWGNIKKTRMDFDSIWTPDIFLSEDVSEELSSGPEKYKTQITCHADGRQQWLVPTLLTSSCQFNIKYFPYDRQKCYLRFMSWAHTQNELDMKIDPRPIVTSNYVKSQEWSIVSVTAVRNVKQYNCCPDPFVDILYTLTIDRLAMYYVYNAIIPCIIQMMIILFTFFLPVESGERIGVVITVLLVFAVYLEIVNGNLPKTSSSVPALSLFYISAMGISSCSLIATCIVLVIHYKGSDKGNNQMPKWVKKLLHGKIASICGVYKNIPVSDDCTEALLTNHINGIYTYKHNLKQNGKDENGIRHDAKDTGNEHNGSDISHLIDQVRVITKVIQEQKNDDTIEKEWQMLAKLLDRFFFFIFLFIYVLITLVILLPAYIHYSTLHDDPTHSDTH